MRVPFNGNFGVTQGFNDSCCRASYAKFGMNGHNGIDYGLPCGTPVVAPISGTISYFNDPSGYGNAVFIRGEGVEVVLGHLSSVSRKSGNVSEGEQIGNSGTTGNSTGCHLHFGVRTYPSYDRNNGFYGYTDPQPYLNKGGDVSASQDRTDETVVQLAYNIGLDRAASKEEVATRVNSGENAERTLRDVASSAEHKRLQDLKNLGVIAEREAWGAKIKNYDGLLKENAELKQKLANAGGVDQTTKNQIAETNNLVKQIWNKITNIFK